MKKSFTAKFLNVMKISAAQIMLALTLGSICQAHTIYGQVLDREITISLTDISFEAALAELERAGGVKFAYNPDWLNEEKRVSLQAVNKTLRAVLDELLTPRQIRYIVHEKEASITLRKQSRTTGDLLNKSTPILTISGIVTDAVSLQPLAGVNVLVKGTMRGTNTDAKGVYALAAEESDILVFTFIGYKATEVQVANQTTIDIALAEDIETLKEVEVNAGYWKVKDKEQTGNIVRVTTQEIQNQPISNPLAALEGRMSGVYIQQTTGVPGGGYNIQIRGRNSIRNTISNNGNYPLYVIDGVPFTPTSLGTGIGSEVLQTMSPLNSFNPADIESIEVLKDADATAIYGSRGANGVVLITTKKAIQGKTSVDVNFYAGTGKVTRTLNLLHTQEYLTMREEGFSNDNASPQVWDYDVNGTWDKNRYTNWQEELIGGTAHLTNVQATVSAGNKHTQFLLSGGYYQESTVFPGNFANKKISGHFNLNHLSENERFRMLMTLSYISDNNNLPRSDLTSRAVTLQPNAPALYDEDGHYNWENGTWLNPLAWYAEQKFEASTDNLVANVTLGYEVIKGLQLKASMGYTTMRLDEIQTSPISSQNPANINRTGSSNFGSGDIKTWIIEPQAEYRHLIGGGNLTVLAGSTFQQNIQETEYLYAYGYTSDALLENIQAAPAMGVGSYNYVMYRYSGVFARINYNWKERYLINLTGRRDGSSRFGPEKQFANFGAIGGAWIVSNEKFLKDKSTVLTFAKLRASYGSTGSDQVPDYGYMDTYSPSTYPYQGIGGLYPSRLVNPEYSWERNRKLEVGTEWGFLHDRMQVVLSWYRNRSDNQLVGYALPVLTGQSSVQYNLPAVVENTGWEVELNTINVRSNTFRWSSYFNLTVPKNVLLEYPNIEGSSYANIYVVGEPLSISKVYQPTGVNTESGEYTFQDINEDGLYSNDDRKAAFTGQDYYGGLGNILVFKGFQLDFLFQFVKQAGMNNMRAFGRPGSSSNQPSSVMGRWQNPGDITEVQRFTQAFGSAYLAYNRGLGSEMIIEDASFIRLKNISFSFQLPSKWLEKIDMQSCRIYLQGQNLLTFTNYSGMDPENQSGILALPPLRILTAGVQIKF